MAVSQHWHGAEPTPAHIKEKFADLHPPLGEMEARVEASRCLYCFDAPCANACPTHIDVPRFIKKIATGNLEGSARTILDANILGESCSRACPVDVLCEGACVFHHYNEKPIQIGQLQRFAMESLHAREDYLPFIPASPTGKRVALVGAGPASLACAAELRRHGVAADIFDNRALPGGLNTYGIAEYKLTLEASLREIERLRGLGIVFHQNEWVDAAKLEELDQQYDAVFLGIGLGAIHGLGIGSEQSMKVINALDFIEGYKSGKILHVAKRVAVIGAGNTAIDAATAAIRLGAEVVTIVYRRGVEQMSAFQFEYEHARHEGVQFLLYMQPMQLTDHGTHAALQLQYMQIAEDGTLSALEGMQSVLDVDLVIPAIGQGTHAAFLQHAGKVKTANGYVLIDRATGQTNNPKYFAGGDCTNGGREVVDAVADGKRAGAGIVAWLQSEAGNHGNA